MSPMASPYPSGELLLDRLIERAPRLAIAILILLGWSLTLAWTPDRQRPLVEGQAAFEALAGYPLRMKMPEARTIELTELASVAQRHAVVAALEILPPAPQQDEATGEAQPEARPRSNFAQAFSDFGSLSAAQARDTRAAAAIARAENLSPGEFMPLDYDLATLTPTDASSGAGKATVNREDGSLTVTKPLLVDGQTRGDATIRIEEGAQILIATSAVASALGAKVDSLPKRIAGALATGTGFIPFHELRGAGIAVEYDPVNDRVSLSMPS